MSKWFTSEQIGFYHGGRQSIQKFNEIISERKKQYPCGSQTQEDTVKSLHSNGYVKIENVFTEEQILNLRKEFDIAHTKGLVTQDNHSFTVIKDPLYVSKTAFDIATSDIIFDISSEFFGCVPSLCTQNFRLSKLSNESANTTQLYHADRNSIKFMKFFIYLNDVDIHGGPLTFVEGSHAKKFYNHLDKYRWSDEEIKHYYGNKKIKKLTANAGDLLIALTTGFHKGLKPENQERRMLTLNYVVHMESDVGKLFRTKKEWVNSLPEHKKALFTFMEIE